MQKGFIFDLNKCTGCNACQIACAIENEVNLPLNWRQVITYNRARHPALPYFHLSLACNHCINPPCQTYCPALAYCKDKKTGALTINADKCIGCHYCSWCCPYDAPVFNPLKGVMEKCTFCQHRLDEELQPACVAICPTNALQLGDFEHWGSMDKIPGLTQTEIKPAVKIIALRKNHVLPEMTDSPYSEETTTKYREMLAKKSMKNKISCLSELPLVVFTVVIAFLIGILGGKLSGEISFPSGLLAAISVIAGIVSSLHLGQKLKAPRAILNWRSSWLSREIICFSVFIIFILLHSLLQPPASFLGWIALFFGLLTLYAIDRVYFILPVKNTLDYRSSNALLTGLFILSVFSAFTFGVILFGLLKLVLFVRSSLQSVSTLSSSIIIFSLLRLLLGFILPVILWMVNPDYFLETMLLFIFAAELIDRCLFYQHMEIITPHMQMSRDLSADVEAVDEYTNTLKK